MEDISDLFSPEALRLLEESGINYETVYQPDEAPVDHEPPTVSDQSVLTQSEAREMQGVSQSVQRAPKISRLCLGQSAKSRRKRARFDLNARVKVANVRKKGACLRCRTLKIPVGNTAFNLRLTNDIYIVFWILAL